jgi:hypothetical protein
MMTSEEGILCPLDFVHVVWLMSRTLIFFLTVPSSMNLGGTHSPHFLMSQHLTAMSRAVLLSIILNGIEGDSTKSSCILNLPVFIRESNRF